MRSTVEIDAERPEDLRQILEPSLDSVNGVSYSIEAEKGRLVVTTETKGLGPLRGCTDTVFRLASLAKKLY